LAPPPAPIAPPPLPLFAAAEAAAEPEPPKVEEPSFSELEVGRPQLEEMGRRTHTPAKGESHIERPAVEWDAAPYAVGPAGDAITHQPSHETVPATEAERPAPAPLEIPEAVPAPPAAVPVPAPEPKARRWAPEPEVVLEAVAAGQSKILHTAFTVQLGELPPALSSPIDNDDEIIE
jgi:hypothetical protein